MKRIFVTISLLLLLSIVIVSAQPLYQNILNGSFKIEKGINISFPGHKEIIDFYGNDSNSKDLSIIKSKPVLIENSIVTELTRSEIRFELIDNGNIEELSFIGVENDNGLSLLDNEDLAAYLTIIPNSKDYLLDYNGSIYLLSMSDHRIRILLSTGFKEQSKGYLEKVAQENDMPGLIWGTRPIVNANGTKFVYETNRSGVDDGSGNSQIWLFDLASNEDSVIYKNGCEVLGWDSRDGIYVNYQNSLVHIDTKTNSEDVIVNDIPLTTLVLYPFAFIPNDKGLLIYNLETQTEDVITDRLINSPENLKVFEKNLLVALIRNEPNGFKTSLLLVDLSSMLYRIWSPNESDNVDDYFWDNRSSQLHVNTTKIGDISVQRTYILNIKDIFGY